MSGISASGQVAGYAGGLFTSSHAFLWTPAAPNATKGSMLDLGALPGYPSSVATSVNASGQVVGYFSLKTQ